MGRMNLNQVFNYLYIVLILCYFQNVLFQNMIFFFVFSVLHQIAGCSNYPKVIDLPVINLNLNFKVALVRLAK